MTAGVSVFLTSAEIITVIVDYITQKSKKIIMKKALLLVSAVLLLAAFSTSCSKGCHCYVKTDVTNSFPVFEDESMSKEDCKAMEQKLNEEEGMGMTIYKCK